MGQLNWEGVAHAPVGTCFGRTVGFYAEYQVDVLVEATLTDAVGCKVGIVNGFCLVVDPR